ncbi:hypothetical protein [Sulfurirhabdus autotrophica]|nr:hypothetical protein [Sulfurirhabdus autotrophica]
MSHSSSHSQGDIESAQIAANMAGALTVLLIVVGYFLSSRLISIVDKSVLKETHKKLIMFSLPIIYLAAAIILAMGIGLFTGVAHN